VQLFLSGIEFEFADKIRSMKGVDYATGCVRDQNKRKWKPLHFADNSQRPDEGEEYDRLWKLRTVFDKLNEAYAKFCNPSEHLAMDEVIVKFKGRVIFRQYITKKRKRFSIKIYKL